MATKSTKLLLILAAGCSLDVTETPPIVWEADLSGEPEYPLVSGSAAAVTQGTQTDAGITLTGLPEGTFAWRIHEGSCNAPGDVLGAGGTYPELTAEDDEADVSAETTLADPPMVDGEQYHAMVQSPDMSAVITCGDFAQR